jgi:hypothetical protein
MHHSPPNVKMLLTAGVHNPQHSRSNPLLLLENASDSVSNNTPNNALGCNICVSITTSSGRKRRIRSLTAVNNTTNGVAHSVTDTIHHAAGRIGHTINKASLSPRSVYFSRSHPYLILCHDSVAGESLTTGLRGFEGLPEDEAPEALPVPVAPPRRPPVRPPTASS